MKIKSRRRKSVNRRDDGSLSYKKLKKMNNVYIKNDKIIIIKDKKLAKQYENRIKKSIKKSMPYWMRKYINY